MNPTSTDGQSETTPDVEQQQDAMNDQLRKDVASWSAARAGESSGLATQPSVPPVKQSAPRATRQKAKVAKVAEVVPAEKKPFKMSYDGTTDRDYIALRIKLGAR